MARPTWKGNISFGLVNIPVTLFPGEQRTDISFRLLDSRDQARVRYERVNEVTGAEVPWDKVVKAFEFDDGNYVLMEDKDFERAAVEATQTIEIEDFTDVADIDPRYFDRPYILVPGKKGEKGYVLLREALRKSGKAGIAKVVIRTKQYLAAVLPMKDALLLCILRFANELRKPEEYDLPSGEISDYKIVTKELELAEQLIDSMTVKWKPEGYHDEYRDKLMAFIEKKAEEGGHVSAPEPEEEEETKPKGEIVNIMYLLKRSMRGAGKESPPGDVEEAPAARPKPKLLEKPVPKAKPKAKAKAAQAKAKAKAKPEAKRRAS